MTDSTVVQFIVSVGGDMMVEKEKKGGRRGEEKERGRERGQKEGGRWREKSGWSKLASVIVHWRQNQYLSGICNETHFINCIF
jgi:hypothetical protein